MEPGAAAPANNQIYGIKVCVPLYKVTINRAADVIVKWLADHPDESLQPATISVTCALASGVSMQAVTMTVGQRG